jgi:hypothetical protein
MLARDTTARQIETTARWLWVALVCVSALGWWGSGYGVWGVLTGGVGTVLTLWLWSRTTAGRRDLPFQALQVGLVFVAALMGLHAVRHGLSQADGYSLSGALDMSLLLHLCLLSLAICLSQSLLAGASDHPGAMLAAGVAMALGPAVAVTFASDQTGSQSLVRLGLAGVAVLAGGCWTLRSILNRGRRRSPVARWGATALSVVAALLAVWLVLLDPASAGLVLAIAGAAFLVGAGLLVGARKPALLIGLALGAAGAGLILLGRWELPRMPELAWLGRGEVLLGVHPEGPANLIGAVGIVGVVALALAALTGLAGGLLSLRKRTTREQLRGLTWSAAALAAGLALAGRRGLYVPAVTMGAALTWGLLPEMCARPRRRAPGIGLVALLLGLVLLLGVVRRQGLAVWSVVTFGGDDRVLHLLGGFLMATVLTWWLGCRRLWLGLTAILLAIAAGGAGEWVQGRYTTRSLEWKDFVYHTLGCGISLIPYLLCVGARLCERRPQPRA